MIRNHEEGNGCRLLGCRSCSTSLLWIACVAAEEGDSGRSGRRLMREAGIYGKTRRRWVTRRSPTRTHPHTGSHQRDSEQTQLQRGSQPVAS
jgi:hypothetical protein